MSSVSSPSSIVSWCHSPSSATVLGGRRTLLATVPMVDLRIHSDPVRVLRDATAGHEHRGAGWISMNGKWKLFLVCRHTSGPRLPSMSHFAALSLLAGRRLLARLEWTKQGSPNHVQRRWIKCRCPSADMGDVFKWRDSAGVLAPIADFATLRGDSFD